MKEKQILFDRDKGRLELSEKAVQLLRLVPEDGSYVGNTFLRRSLGWPDENEYWAAGQELLDTGIIQTGKGRGGSVALASLPTKKGEGRTADVTAATAAEEIVSEIEEKLAKGGELVGEETERPVEKMDRVNIGSTRGRSWGLFLGEGHGFSVWSQKGKRPMVSARCHVSPGEYV